MIGGILSAIGSAVGGVASAAGQVGAGALGAAGTVVSGGGQVLATTARGIGHVGGQVIEAAPTILEAGGNLYGAYAGYQQQKAQTDLANKMLALNARNPLNPGVTVPVQGATPAVIQPTKMQTDAPAFDQLLPLLVIGLAVLLLVRK